MKAVILAGGFGKRLKPLTNDKPKPMIEIAGKPIIEHQIEWLSGHDIKEIIICVGYLKEVLIDRIGSGRRLSVNVGYSVEEEPLGTGGGIKNAKSLIDGDKFIVINGDVLTNINPWNLVEDVDHTKVKGAIASVPLPCPYGIIEMKDGFAKRFVEKPILKEHWINAGIYCLSTSVLDTLPSKGNLEQSTLPALALSGSLKITQFEQAYWRSIDSHKDIEEANKEYESVDEKSARPIEVVEKKVIMNSMVAPLAEVKRGLAFDIFP